MKTIFAVVVLFVVLTQTLIVRTNALHNPEVREYDEKLDVDDDTSILTTNQGKCGGVINSTNYIRINYKPFEEILPNERCVWIIMTAYNTNVSLSYTVIANALGFPATERLLSYTSLRKQTEAIFTSYPTGPGNTVVMTGGVLLVTFSSNSNTSGLTGFTLTIYPSTTRGPGINPESRYEILNQDDFYHRHPKSPGNYLANELSAFVLPPVGFNGNRFQKQIVRCKEVQLENKMYDWIGVHLFDATTSSWKYKGRLGGQFALEKITHDDIILIVFDTDEAGQYQGFELHTLTA